MHLYEDRGIERSSSTSSSVSGEASRRITDEKFRGNLRAISSHGSGQSSRPVRVHIDSLVEFEGHR